MGWRVDTAENQLKNAVERLEKIRHTHIAEYVRQAIQEVKNCRLNLAKIIKNEPALLEREREENTRLQLDVDEELARGIPQQDMDPSSDPQP